VPVPDPAATVLALRPSEDPSDEGFQVLMVHRNSRGFFGDIVVFPGGRVDDVDAGRGGVDDEDTAHRWAALREFAEEAGILVTVDGSVSAPGLRDAAFYEWLDDQPFTPGLDRLVLVSRWVTPEIAPRRFDTRFYVVACLDPPEVEIDSDELVWHEWVAPEVALERQRSGDWSMMQPTISHLRWLSRRVSIEDALCSAQGADGRKTTVPWVDDDGSMLAIHMPVEHL